MKYKQVKKTVLLFVLNHLPFLLRYGIYFKLEKKRWPRLLFPKDYSDYIARDNYLGNHNKHAYLADKLEVRKYVQEKDLESILIPLLGYWDDARKIDFDKLPDQFAIKCNHSCGMNIICHDKRNLNVEETRETLNRWLHEKHAKFFERHYFHIKPMILAEKLISNGIEGESPNDYKIHCAAGEPKFIQVCIERDASNGSKMRAYDTNWNVTNYIAHTSHYSDKDIPKPKHLHEMLEYARILSKGLDYARVDFYDTNEQVYFGEITLTPQGGWLTNFSQEALDMMGQAIADGKRRK